MRRKYRPFFVALVAGSVVTLLAACGSANAPAGSNTSAPAKSSAGQELDIGIPAALTGPNSAWGIAESGGATIAAEEINAAGGVKVNGTKYTLKIIAEDDQFTPVGAAQAVSRLISQDDVKYVIGPVTGTAVAAVQSTLQQNGILNLELGFGDGLVSPKFPLSFRTIVTPSEYCGAWYRWVSTTHPSIKRVALVGPNSSVGKGSIAPCVTGTASAGIAAKSFYYNTPTQDYSSLAATILAYKPDAVDVTGAAPADAAGIIKQLDQDGYTGVTMKTGAEAANTIAQVVGSSAKGHLYFVQVPPTDPKVASFLSAFTKKYKSTGEENEAIVAHDSVYLLADALEKSGSTDPTAVAKALGGTNTYTLPLLGPITWGGSKTFGIPNQILTNGYIEQWTGSAGKVVGKIKTSSP